MLALMVVIGMPAFAGAGVIYSENFESNLSETTDTTNGIVGYDSWRSLLNSPKQSYISVAWNDVLGSYALDAQSGAYKQYNKIGRYLDTVNHTGLNMDAVTVMSFTAYAINAAGSSYYRPDGSTTSSYSHSDSIGLDDDNNYTGGAYWYANNHSTHIPGIDGASGGLVWEFIVNGTKAGSFAVTSGNSLVNLSIVVDGTRNVVYGKVFDKDGTCIYTTGEIGESDAWIAGLNELFVHQYIMPSTWTTFNGVYFDSIQVSVPEPGTLLLGFGLLGLGGQQLRRRARA